MLPKIGKRLMNGLTTRVARPQATQRFNDCVYPIRRIAQHRTQRLHAFLGLGRSLPIGGSKRVTQMRSGMIELEDLFPNRSKSSSPSLGVKCATTQVACFAAHGVQEPSMIPARSSRGHKA